MGIHLFLLIFDILGHISRSSTFPLDFWFMVLYVCGSSKNLSNMATLSKQVIENIAQKMTEKSKKFAEKLKNDYQEIVTFYMEAQAPDEVKKCFKNHPDYIETTGNAYLDGYGFNRESVSLNKQVPAITSYHASLNLTSAIADKILKAKRKYEKAKEDYKQLVQETESALFALKTHKNIRENLSEAIPYLPPPMSNSLVVNFDSLQKKLNKQPEVKETVTN